jgi:phosphomannomutase
VALRKGEEFVRRSIATELGEDKLQEFINFTLKELSQIILPKKRGTFLEYRNGIINICPIGRNCKQVNIILRKGTQEEREAFQKYD